MKLTISVDRVGQLMSMLNRAGIASTTPGLSYDVVAQSLTYPEAIAAIVAGFDAEASDRSALVAYAAHKRWLVETGGITISGMPVNTDRDSQALISGAFAFVQYDPAETIRFKTAGGFVALDAATMTAVAVAVAEHVQASFAKEADVVTAINAGTITTVEAIDAAFE